MKKHTVKLEWNTTLCQYDIQNKSLLIDMCAEGLREFLELPSNLPEILYVTISSRKFKNSFPIKLIQHSRLKNLLEGVIVDERKIETSWEQSMYLKEQLGSFNNNPTIHILFEIE